MSEEGLAEGLYEELITAHLLDRLSLLVGQEVRESNIDDAEQPSLLARHVARAVERSLSGTKDPQRRLELVNSLISLAGQDLDLLSDGPRRLLAIGHPAGPGTHRSLTSARPATPLAEAALLTNAEDEPKLGPEVKAELASADRVDLLCAFIMWPGLRVLDAELRELKERGVRLRVITTTYLGGTQKLALDRLVNDYGAEVRVEFNAVRTRLHAKAWLFHRNSGFHTAYVGSSNLTHTAMLDGVEWNVRLAEIATPGLLRTFRATFDRYWNSPHFRPYSPDRNGPELEDALARAKRGDRSVSTGRIELSGLEVRPFPHQEMILERLAVEREVRGRHRNLVVSATGTGKTVVAALDYKRLSAPLSRRPTLLFVAHRRELLQQSLRTYREVLGDANFGEVFFEGQRPERWQHVFASVQSLASFGVAKLPRDAFDVVVIDEFHHGAAASYRRLLEHLAPKELLGLTATPERGDGIDVREFFGGHTAAEVRLWDALEEDLLTPFHYFGIADGVDVSSVGWSHGAYDVDGLSRLYTGNDARARIILSAVRDKVTDPMTMRALGFCVSIDHARYMARVFTEAGLPAVAVDSREGSYDRDEALRELAAGEITTVFTVDMFNEGIDVPSVDTVLFLRPTESPTIFLQQLGRGLRLADNKPVCTVLDFVGNQRAEFRFDRRFQAITGATREGLRRQVEKGFPFLPGGTQIVLDRQSQAAVLANLKAQVVSTKLQITRELRSHPTDDLAEFLRESGVELQDVVRADRSWTQMRRDAGLEVPPPGPREKELLRRVRAFAHVDDPERAAAYLRWLSDDAPAYDDPIVSELDRAFGRMLFFSLWTDGGGFDSYAAGLASLRAEPNVRHDLREVIRLGLSRAEHVPQPLPGDLAQVPLRIGASYTREEVVTALQYVSVDGRKPNSFREGVLWSEPLRTDAFFVTLHKSEEDYSPSTMYRDYFISPELFHWESQSTTAAASRTGQRYINHQARGTHVLLFSRDHKVTEFGSGAPYRFYGPMTYQSHEGERPMAITWLLNARHGGDAPASPVDS
jgi:superfamily II DNA or RNA helicase/HKD family nuclease